MSIPMLGIAGPYLVFNGDQPVAWCYFRLNEQHQVVDRYAAPYAADVNTLVWPLAEPLTEEDRLYAFDPSEQIPRAVCVFCIDQKLYKSPCNTYGTKTIPGRPQPARLDKTGEIFWGAALNPKATDVSEVRIASVVIDEKLYPKAWSYQVPLLPPAAQEISEAKRLNPPVAIHDAHEALQVKQCYIVAHASAVPSADGAMHVWREENQWHYHVSLLGQAHTGIWDARKDAEIIAYLAAHTQVSDDLVADMGGLRLRLSRPYLHLTLDEQNRIVATMRHEWPVAAAWSDALNRDVLRALLQGGDFSTQEPLSEALKAEVGSTRVNFRHRYLIPDKIDEHFKKDLVTAWISTVWQFNRYLLLAAAQQLGEAIANLKLSAISAQYNVPCGSLAQAASAGLNPTESDLFIVMAYPQRYDLALLAEAALAHLESKVLGIVDYAPEYRAVADDLLVFFRDQRTHEAAATVMTNHCHEMLIAIAWQMYRNNHLTIEELGEKLSRSIHRYDQLSTIVAGLDHDSGVALVAAWGNHLKARIKNGDQLAGVLSQLDSKAQTALITALGGHLKTLIQDSDQLASVLSRLGAKGQAALITALGDHFKTLIQDVSQLGKVLATLGTLAQVELIGALGDQLKALIKNSDQLQDILSKLNAVARTTFITALGDHFKTLIQDVSQLGGVLYALYIVEGRQACITALGDQLKVLIKNGDQLQGILSQLDIKARTTLITALDGHLKTLIQDRDQLESVLSKLDREGQAALTTALGWEHLKALIENGDQLKSVLSQLDNKARTTLITALDGHLKTLIQNRDQLESVLSKLDTASQIALLTVLGDHLKTLIRGANELFDVFRRLGAAVPCFIIFCNLGSNAVIWARADEAFNTHIKAVLKKDEVIALKDDPSYGAQHALLSYIFNDKHTTIPAFANTPAKLAAAEWLLKVLSKEVAYTRAEFYTHKATLTVGELGGIFQRYAIQNCLKSLSTTNIVPADRHRESPQIADLELRRGPTTGAGAGV